MPRTGRSPVAVQTFTVACGTTNQNNPVDAQVPGPAATLISQAYTTKTAGTGTGTFSVQVTYGSAPTTVGAATATTFIDADGVAGTVHGTTTNSDRVTAQEGARLGIKTVKAGTVTGDATLIVTLIWQL